MKEFVQYDVLIPRLKQSGVLVVYDPDRRYRDLCLDLETDARQVINASGSSIESREAALGALQELGQSKSPERELIVYVPASSPRTEEDRQRDPFAVFSASGEQFPSGDGDEYLSLCLKAKPDYATEIRRVFDENSSPSFDVIDAIGAGTGWPTLQVSLRVESARDILLALLTPTNDHTAELTAENSWVAEAKSLFRGALGLKLKTRSKNWSTIADELWRFLLFSEFVFDLPEPLPQALSDVPKADQDAQLLIEDLCDRLRNDKRSQSIYIERAEVIEEALNLPSACEQVGDLGIRDTFPFEERSFFAQAVESLRQDDLDGARSVIRRHDDSVWVGRGESQAKWTHLNAALDLIQACGDIERQLPEHDQSQDSVIEFYVGILRQVDRLHRELEQARGGYFNYDGELGEVTALARTFYRRLANRVQELFLHHLKQVGWPPEGRIQNSDCFDRFISPKLYEIGNRVAVFLIDAMRYELGVELQKELADDVQSEIHVAFAQIPTTTPVGMASLLPEAGRELRLVDTEGGFTPYLGDKPISTVPQRMELLRARYGQRFAEARLREFADGGIQVDEHVDLFVLRSNEMDRDFETNADAAPGLITHTFHQIRGAIHLLRGQGFRDAYILTDHGFFLNTGAEAGDVAGKPEGNWTTVHDRLLLGDGTENDANVVFPADLLGIRGDYNQVAVPRSMVAYRAGLRYFHGGISLQEAVVPVIELSLTEEDESAAVPPAVSLSYRRGTEKITTRLPVVEVQVSASDLFSMGTTMDVLLEAHDPEGNVIGEAKPGGPVNPATLTLSLDQGSITQVTVKMDVEFEGRFTLKALDPATLTTYDALELETNYLT